MEKSKCKTCEFGVVTKTEQGDETVFCLIQKIKIPRVIVECSVFSQKGTGQQPLNEVAPIQM